MRTLRFYFDYISHNAYVAWTQLPPLAERYDLEIEPVPVLFAALLEASGTLGPAEIPAKARWMHRDVARKAKNLGIPLAAPAHHPFHPIATLRASSLPLPWAERKRLIDALFAATWAEAQEIGDPKVVAQVLSEAGFDGDALMAEANSAENKARLREQNEAAVAAGVFGVPTMVVDEALFWGYDDFPSLEQFLRGEDPIAGDPLREWLEVEPAVTRKRS